MTNSDPRRIIADSPMSRLQIAAIALIIGLNALDGFDVLSISFASPGISKEWGIDRAALGLVLSMELIGMAAGSILLGGVADRIGRRPTILGCLLGMTLGMAMATTAHGVVELSIWRVITGLGIGGMLAAINAAAAEFSSARRRSLCLALMVIGYPLGAVIGGTIAARLLKSNDWRVVFEFGAFTTAAFIPLVWFFLPETPAFLVARRPRGALERVNAVLARFGHIAVPALPPQDPIDMRASVADILKPGLIGTTLLVALAYFLHITTFYFILKWTPKIVADMGFVASAAAGVLVWANIGGAAGGAVFGALTQRFSLKALTIATMLMSTVMVSLFGRGVPDLTQLALAAGMAGFFTNAGVVGLYSIFAEAFPTHVRATGTGFAIGFGRGGSALAPIIGGLLFQAGQDFQTVAIIMATGSLLAAACLFALKLRPETIS